MAHLEVDRRVAAWVDQHNFPKTRSALPHWICSQKTDPLTSRFDMDTIIGLAVGEYMLMSRFNLFSGTSSTEEANAWEMNFTGWFLVLLPFAMLVIGLIIGRLRSGKENYDAGHNFGS